MVQPIVSLVITTKNEEKNIGNCLESILRQTYPKNLLEVIVVDNDSTDKTKQVTGEYNGVKVFDKGPERSAQRNFGIEKSEGKYIIYLDADMILSPTVIEKAIEKFQMPLSPISNISPVALYIPEVVIGNSYWSRVRRFERSFYDGTVVDSVRIVRKDVFDKVDGFDSSLTGPEDWDFDKKIRGKGKVEVLGTYNFKEIHEKLVKINYTEADLVEKLGKLSSCAIVYHNEASFDIKKYLQKKRYYVKSFGTYINKWGADDPGVKKQFGFWYRYFGIFWENGKWKRFFGYPSLTFGVFLLRVLVGVLFIFNRKKDNKF